MIFLYWFTAIRLSIIFYILILDTAEMSDEEVDDKVSHAGHLYTKKNTVADMFWMAGTAIYAFMG